MRVNYRLAFVLRTVVPVALMLCGPARAQNVTHDIISNNITAIDGHADTVWLLSTSGINFTVAKTVAADSLSWWSYATPMQPLALAFGNAAVLICLNSADNLSPNKLLYYSYADSQARQIDLRWDRSRLSFLTPAQQNTTYLLAVNTVFCSGFFYCACVNGGLVQLSRPGGQAQKSALFYPGINKRVYDPASFPPDTSLRSIITDSTRAILGVAGRNARADSAALYAFSLNKIWRLSLRDTTWDSLAPPNLTGGTVRSWEYNGLFVSPTTGLVYAAITTTRDSSVSDTFYVYDTAASRWKPFIPEKVIAATFGNGLVYAIHGNAVDALSDSLSALPNARVRNLDFSNRIGQIPYPQLTAIAYFAHSADSEATLWIGSTDGLFVSTHELADEATRAVFTHVKRSPKINDNLEKTYAVPGILTADPFNDRSRSFAYFAYNLGAAAKVTIRIFDWNMNLVKTVIKDQQRPAGKENVSGRSTDERYDTWDGTNGAGKPVPVGVYYYKITASTGQRSFGRIIVAK
ncbi:MAG: hypothetical protein PHC61_01415 [Chitinivibrionales bacterium]|nr:hypothetical protein [Chitinivibrionales bacterium]